MLLAVDVGNTTISLGLFEGETLLGDWRLSTTAQRTPDELGLMMTGLLRRHLDPEKISGVVICSVVPRLNESLSYVFSRYFDIKPVFLNNDLGLVPLEVDDPSAVGADRISDCLAGYRLFGGPLLIIDFGSASTFDLISESGAFLGGAIAPEMGAASHSLFKTTALLPEVELELPPSVVGKNTNDNLKAGVVLGFLELIDGLVGRYQREYPQPLKVVATGGRGAFYQKHLDSIEIYEPHLTLIGLRLTWEEVQQRGLK